MLVTIYDDFDLHKIAISGQCFRCVNYGDTYRFITGQHVLYIKKTEETIYEVSCTQDEWESVWIAYFDLERNYRSIRIQAQSDSFLHTASEAGQGIRILKQDAWEMLITFIISQRKNIPAIKKSVEALAELCGTAIDTPYERVYTFPTALELSRASDEELTGCTLGYRLPYVKDAISKVVSGELRLDTLSQLDNEALMATLQSVKGVGEKVGNCVMLFAYGRTSRVPVDTWIKKIIAEKFNGENRFLRYGENAGVMQQYAFYYILQHKSEV